MENMLKCQAISRDFHMLENIRVNVALILNKILRLVLKFLLRIETCRKTEAIQIKLLLNLTGILGK